MRLTFDPDIPTCGNGKDEEEANEQEGFEVVCGYALCGKDHGSDELTLCSAKACAENDAETASVGGLYRRRNFGCMTVSTKKRARRLGRT